VRVEKQHRDVSRLADAFTPAIWRGVAVELGMFGEVLLGHSPAQSEDGLLLDVSAFT